MSKFTPEQLENLNGTTSSRHGFIMHFTVMELFEDMPPTEKGLVIEVIFKYVATGVDNQDPRIKKGSLGYFAIKQFKTLYAKDASKWLEKSQKNSDSGRKGGSAKKDEQPEHDTETGEVINS